MDGLRYEVMYFLQAPDDTLGRSRAVWAGIGDSIVVVGGEGLWNCHIHTDDIGAAMEAALDVGRPSDIRVTDLRDQVEEESWVRRARRARGGHLRASGTAAGDLGRRSRHRRRDPAHLLLPGVHHIVAGGQSMNPSTEQILEVVDSVPGSQVVVLPNNKNIVPVAEQVRELCGTRLGSSSPPGIQEGRGPARVPTRRDR